MTNDPSTTESPGTEPQAVRNGWWLFYRRWRKVIIVLGCLAVTLTAIKIQQDWARHVAQRDIAAMGFRLSISSLPGHRVVGDCVATKPELTDAEVERLAAHLTTMSRRHDLWFSHGLEIRLVDLSDSHTSIEAINELQKLLPTTEVQR